MFKIINRILKNLRLVGILKKNKMMCPDFHKKCIKEKCISYTVSTDVTVQDISNLVTVALKQKIASPTPCVFRLDNVGYCKKYKMIMDRGAIRKFEKIISVTSNEEEL